ncbi:MAG TPA: outer membrane beta-barrel protein, partial [Cyclobacteriaceae bacterium]
MRFTLLVVLAVTRVMAQDGTVVKTPFSHGDFSWLNGNNRQTQPSPIGNKYFNPSIIADFYYTYSFNNPKDNTINSSSIMGRHNEMTMNMISLGFEANYKNAYAKVFTQFGSILSVIQETDPTPNRGRNLRTGDLKYIREAYLGYHWDKWHGVNFDAGIYMSFIGLESYVSQENWSYQRSMVCDYTPFYFNGMRLQIHPNSKWKIEPWLMNGWYSYGKFNQGFSGGLSVSYRPKENIATVANFYYGTDTRPNPAIVNPQDRIRFHHDNSVMIRYAHRPESKGVSKAAFSLNSHYGFEEGG